MSVIYIGCECERCHRTCSLREGETLCDRCANLPPKPPRQLREMTRSELHWEIFQWGMVAGWIVTEIIRALVG